MAANGETIYLKGDRDVEVTKADVFLGDILSVECGDKNLVPKIKAIKIFKFPQKGKKRYVISILKVIACIHEQYPELEIQNLGESDMIITYENQKTPGKTMHIIKAAFVSVLIFVGAAFSIMAFNNDISVKDLFSQIYEGATGMKTDGFTILEVCYSIGVTIGILLFFNHFGKKKFSVDPTPLEVQMRVYENDIQTTLVENASRREEELDVGKSDFPGSHRP